MLISSRKFNYDSTDNGKIFARELNNIKNELNSLIAKTGNKLVETDEEVLKAVDELVKNSIYLDTGTVNNVLLSRIGFSTTIETYEDGMFIFFICNNTNSGPVTVNINNLGDKPIYFNNLNIEVNTIVADNMYGIRYDVSKDAFELASFANLGNIVTFLERKVIGLLTQDPDGIIEDIIITKHNNCPDGEKYWYIKTVFVGEIADRSNRMQIATEYNPGTDLGARCYVRTIKDNIPRAWSKLSSIDLETELLNKFRDGVIVDYDTLGKIEVLTKNLETTASGLTEIYDGLADKFGNENIRFAVSDVALPFDPVAEESYYSLNKKTLLAHLENSRLTSTTLDPNKITSINALIKHPNAPDGDNEWLILVNHYGYGGTTGDLYNTCQIAIENNPSSTYNRIFYRNAVNGVISEWIELDNKGKFDELLGKFSFGLSFPENPKVEDIFLNTYTGSVYIYGFNGFNDTWLVIQENTTSNAINHTIAPDADGAIVIDPLIDPELSVVTQESTQAPWFKVKPTVDTIYPETVLTANGKVIPQDVATEEESKIIKIVNARTCHIFLTEDKFGNRRALYSGRIFGNLNFETPITERSAVPVYLWHDNFSIDDIAYAGFGTADNYCLVVSNGKLYGKGYAPSGGFGNGLTELLDWTEITQITNVKSVNIGGMGTSYVITNNNELYACGYNTYYQVGNSSNVNATSWVKVIDNNVDKVYVTDKKAYALITDGTVRGTGSSENGTFGTGSATIQNVYFANLGLTNIKSLAVASLFTVAVTNAGEIYGTGHNYYGCLGLGESVGIVNTWTLLSLTNVDYAIASDRVLITYPNRKIAGEIYLGKFSFGLPRYDIDKYKSYTWVDLDSSVDYIFPTLGNPDEFYNTFIYSYSENITFSDLLACGNNGYGRLGVDSEFNLIITDDIVETLTSVVDTDIENNFNIVYAETTLIEPAMELDFETTSPLLTFKSDVWTIE